MRYFIGKRESIFATLKVYAILTNKQMLNKHKELHIDSMFQNNLLIWSENPGN